MEFKLFFYVLSYLLYFSIERDSIMIVFRELYKFH